MRLYIIRHGDPDYAHDALTPAGEREALALADRLARHGLDRIYSSPFGRARQTARYTANRLGIDVVIEEWARELAGWGIEEDPWGGLVAWDIPGEIIRQGPYPTHDSWHLAPPFDQAPRLRQHFERIALASDDFLSRHGYAREDGRYRVLMPNREQIAVFCHNGLALTWLAHLLELPLTLCWAGFWLAPSTVTTVLFEERSAEWAVPRCIGLGDVSHLYAAGLPVQPRGIQANFR
jgi:probable phosphoglycerate mutase